MSDHEQHEEHEEGRSRWWMSRRSFLSTGALGAAGLALGSGVPGASAATATNDVDAMTLQVATVAAAYPVRYRPRDGKSVPERLTGRHLAATRKRCSQERLERARHAAQRLVDRGLGGAKAERLLDELGAVAAKGGKDLADLQAMVAVAAATLADSVDPDNDLLARLWLGGLANRHRRLTAATGGTP